MYVVSEFFGGSYHAFRFDKPSYFGDPIGNRLLGDYFSLAHFLISFLVCALASLIVKVFSGLVLRAAFFWRAL